MKKVILIIIMLMIIIATVACEQSGNDIVVEELDNVNSTIELDIEDINFAVIVDDVKQQCFIVTVLDIITIEADYLIITLDRDILISKEEVIFCKTYSEADVWLEIVSGLNG